MITSINVAGWVLVVKRSVYSVRGETNNPMRDDQFTWKIFLCYFFKLNGRRWNSHNFQSVEIEEGRLIECEVSYPELFVMLEIMNFLGLDCRAAIKPINSMGSDLRAAVGAQTHSLT